MMTTSSTADRVPDPGPCTNRAHCFNRGARVCNCGDATRAGVCSGWAVRSRLSGVEIEGGRRVPPRAVPIRSFVDDLMRPLRVNPVPLPRVDPGDVDRAYRRAVSRANRFVLISVIPIAAVVAALYLMGANGVVLTIVPSLVGAMMTAMFAAHLNKTSKLQAENTRLRARLAEASEHREWCYYCGSSVDDHELDCELYVSDGRATLPPTT